MQLPTEFYIRNIEETLDRTRQQVEHVLNGPGSDRYKIVRLLETIGELEGALVFLRSEMKIPEKKPWWKFWK